MKRSILYPIACIVVNLVAFSATKAQIPKEPVNIQSPNAAGLGRYGEYPVSYYTGVPQIGIPLYTLKEKEISVPISLSYHASGFRPDEHPGWVGQGWSLNAGGVITRVVNQKPDEEHISGPIAGNATLLDHYGVQPDGYFFNYGLNAGASWNTTTNMGTIATSMHSTTNNFDQSSLPDTEPDEFDFNFDGYSGSFFLNSDGTWRIKCDKPIKITPISQLTYLAVPFTPPTASQFYTDEVGYSPSIAGFTITTEDGTQYVFGGSTTSIEYSIGMFSQNYDDWIASAWYLTSIISKNANETVSFNYLPDSFIDQLDISISLIEGVNFVSNGGSSCQSQSFVPIFYGGKLIRPVYLQSIKTTGYEVDFSHSISTELGYGEAIYDDLDDYGTRPPTAPFLPFINSKPIISQSVQQVSIIKPDIQSNPDYYPACLGNLQWQELDKITIINNTTPTPTTIKQFNFSYTTDNTIRLSLKSVTEADGNNVLNPPYVFNYHQSTHGLPGYLAFQTDHWGFWNGITSMADDAADFQSDVNNYYTNRQPATDPEYAEANVLSEIKYPTGGITDFTYELNNYTKSINSNRTSYTTLTTNAITGGLRIQSIKASDPQSLSQSFEKDYFYVTNYDHNYTPGSTAYLSSGILGGQAQYQFPMTVTGTDGINYVANSFSSQSVLAVSNNSMGSHVGYSEVVEKRSDGSYTKYLFSNFTGLDGNHYDEPAATTNQTLTMYQPFSSLSEERGKLLREETHNVNDQVTRSVDYRYTALDKANQFARSIKTRAISLCPSASVAYYVEGSAFGNYTYSYLLTSKTTTDFDVSGGNAVTTSETYAYDNPLHRQVTRSYVTDSKGETLVKVNVYPQDYASPTGFVQQMIAINNIGGPIEKAAFRSTTGASPIFNVISGSLTEYPAATGDYPSTSYTLDLTNPLPLATTSSTTSFVLSNGWSVPLLSTTAMSVGGSYVRDSHYRAAASFDYDHEKLKDFNIYTTQTVANLSTVFLWDVSRRYPVAEVKNANSTKIAFTSFEEAETPGATRLNNPNNWNIPAGVMNNNITARTGQYCGYITGATISTVDPIPIGTYTVSYWSKAGPATISGGTVQSTKIGPTSPTGWTYYEHTMQLSSAANVSVAGNASAQYIDDLRLYPVGALMTSYTYSPLVGMTSATDAKNETTFYEYDSFQRLLNIKDKDGSIVKHMTYHYQGQ